MRIYLIITAILTVITLISPFIINEAFSSATQVEPKAVSEISSIEQITTEKLKQNETINVINASSGITVETDLLEYIIGVVAAEMPASFCIEALKAQAIASYTYTMYIKSNGKSEISDSSTIHQSYINKTEQKEKWGDSYHEYRSIIENAVESVFREYLSYDNKIAMTVFHSLSHDKTNSSEEIWREAVPYLVSVKSPSDITYENEIKFTADEFKSLFENKTEIRLSSESDKWAKIIEKNSDGYIRKLSVGEKTFTAIEIAEILSLPSVNFSAKYNKDNFIFDIKGKGHGVGMSQYGAEYMARQGKTYKEILAHYYPGTELKSN